MEGKYIMTHHELTVENKELKKQVDKPKANVPKGQIEELKR